MKTCPDCGCRVYKYGCVNCNETAYIDEQVMLTQQYGTDQKPRLNDACVGRIISETPFVKLLTVPKFNDMAQRWECLAQVNEMLAMIEVTFKSDGK